MSIPSKPIYNSDTIIALATPSGIGAIGVIRLSGPDAITLVNEVFNGKDLSIQKTHTIHFGTIRDGDLILDEVLASIFIGPKSYTKENVVEISTHGSAFIIENIIKLLIRKGARPANPGEFTLRAFLNGQLDLSQAEAVADLIASNSQASHQVAMQQMRGGFSHELQHLRNQLIHFASMIELELDFGEEDVEFANREDLKGLIYQIQRILHRLIQSFEQGNVMKNGVPVVIAGKPNVGKSTLLNALLNEERAIVSEIAGTTRDTVEDELIIGGINFRFIDTAGIRDTVDVIEAKGVERTHEKIGQAKLIIYLVDPEQEIGEIRSQMEYLEGLGVPFITVVNKNDIASREFIQRLSVISYPLPGESNQLPVTSYQLPGESEKDTSQTKDSSLSVQSDNGQLSTDNSSSAQPDNRQLATDNSSSAHPGNGQLATDNSSSAQPDNGQWATDNSSSAQPDNGQLATDNSSSAQPDNGQLSTDNSSSAQPDNGQLATDNSSSAHPGSRQLATGNPNILFISAKHKQGIDALKNTILQTINLHSINTDDVLISNIRHLEALQKTEASLNSVLENIDNPVTSDFLATDIKQALYYLGEITGQVTTDDLLETIFSKFCIGK